MIDEKKILIVLLIINILMTLALMTKIPDYTQPNGLDSLRWLVERMSNKIENIESKVNDLTDTQNAKESQITNDKENN